MRHLLLAVFATSLLTVACDKGTETAAVSGRADFIGKWEGRMTVTDEQIDFIHNLYPEGDRDVLAPSYREIQESIVYGLDLRDDGTMSMGVVGSPASPIEGTWELSEDQELITVSYQGGTGSSQTITVDPKTGVKTVTETELEPVMSTVSYKVAADGLSFTQLGGNNETLGPLKYSRPGATTPPKPAIEDPYTYAKSGELADFVGSWVRSTEWADAIFDGMRGTMSEEALQKSIDMFKSQKVTMEIYADMTYVNTSTVFDSDTLEEDIPTLVDRVQEGSWTLSADGAAALLALPFSEQEIEEMGLSGNEMELRLTEDRSMLVQQDMSGRGNPVMSYKRE